MLLHSQASSNNHTQMEVGPSGGQRFKFKTRLNRVHSAIKHKQVDQSNTGTAVKKDTSVGTVEIKNNKVDHQWVIVDQGCQSNTKISRETRTLFA